MDEMEIKKKVEYDKGLKKFVGFITPEIAANEEEKGTVASKMLVFVVKGLTLKWKQTVAYFLTGSSIDSEKLWECTSSIIRSLHDEGLNVRGVVSDMGPNNVKMWRDLGIHAVEGSTRDSIDHPIVEGQRLYFTPDLAHLLKNTWTSLISQDFYLPDALAEEHPEWQGHLTVSASHVKTLIELQDQPEDRGITMQYKLHKYHVEPSHLQKMKVRSAAEFFSRSTTIALRFCAANDNIPEIDHQALPTAWFLEQMDRWFDIMNDRKYGIDGADRGEQKLAELEDFRQLITSIKFQRQGWKPLQTGIILATSSTISLHEDLVRNGPFRYLLPGRKITDCVENFIAQVRQVANHHPGPVEAKNALRLISVAQFFYVPRSSNYEDEDDGEYIADFLKKREKPHEIDRIEEEDFADPEQLTILQEQGLYKTAGWIAKKVTPPACDSCLEVMISLEPLAECPSQWTSMLSRGGLTHPSLPLYRLLEVAEMVFNSLKHTILHCINPIDTMCDQIVEHVDGELREALLTDCGHSMLSAAISKFVHFRVHVLAEDRTRRIPLEVAHAGRACYMATAADRR